MQLPPSPPRGSHSSSAYTQTLSHQSSPEKSLPHDVAAEPTARRVSGTHTTTETATYLVTTRPPLWKVEMTRATGPPEPDSGQLPRSYDIMTVPGPVHLPPQHAQLRWLLELLALHTVYENHSATCRRLGGREEFVSPMYCDTTLVLPEKCNGERGASLPRCIDDPGLTRLPQLLRSGRPTHPARARPERLLLESGGARLRCGHTESAVNTRRTN